jgi:hypothetical protein
MVWSKQPECSNSEKKKTKNKKHKTTTTTTTTTTNNSVGLIFINIPVFLSLPINMSCLIWAQGNSNGRLSEELTETNKQNECTLYLHKHVSKMYITTYIH